MGDQSLYGKCTSSGTAPYVHGYVGKPVAGKTGTTDNNRTAAMIAMTKQLAVAGIVADPDWILDDVGPDHLDGKDAHKYVVNPAVAYTLRAGMKNKPALQFTKPGQKIAFGTKASIPSVTCKSVSEATSILKSHGFTVNVEESKVNSSCPAGTVAGTSPSGSTSKGSSVSLQISNGNGGTVGPVGNQTNSPGHHGIIPMLPCPAICRPNDPFEEMP
jgi:membrane peptidoglycan carboxypeptidase